MTLSDSEFTLASGESKEVVLHAVSDREAGISSGSLRVEGYGVVSIPVVVEISSQLVLFDGTLYISPKDKEVLPGDGLPVQVTLFNVGSPRKVDVLLNYIISDAEGVTVWEESETIAVEEQHSFNREFYVPSDLGYGSYVLGMEVIYVNSVATSTTMFNVVDQVSRMPLDIEEGFVWYMIVGIVVLILLLVGFVVLKGLYGGEQMVKDLKQGELEKVKKDISELKSAIKKVRK
jgi:hypothetical protein